MREPFIHGIFSRSINAFVHINCLFIVWRQQIFPIPPNDQEGQPFFFLIAMENGAE